MASREVITPDPLAEFRPSGKPCKVARALAAMAPERAAVVVQALAGDERIYTSNKIRSVLASRDRIQISGDTWIKHRRSQCSCGRDEA